MFPLLPPSIYYEVWDQMPWSWFFQYWVSKKKKILSIKLAFSLSSSLSSRDSWVSLHLLPSEWYHLYIWGCWYFSQEPWFQLVLCPLAFHVMYSAWKLNKQGDDIQPCCTPFLILNQSIVSCKVLTVASWPTSRFLRRWVRWSGTPISWNFPKFVVIHTVKGFSVVNEAEVDSFLEFPCFLHHLTNVGNLISAPFAFSKLSLYIWKFSVHVLLKPTLKNFEDNLASMWRVQLYPRRVPLSPHLFQLFVICKLLNIGHFDWCEVILHCRLDLHFSKN